MITRTVLNVRGFGEGCSAARLALASTSSAHNSDRLSPQTATGPAGRLRQAQRRNLERPARNLRTFPRERRSAHRLRQAQPIAEGGS